MNLALNPFDKGRKPEVVQEIKLEEHVLKKTLESYNTYCDMKWRKWINDKTAPYKGGWVLRDDHEWFERQLKLEVLTPSQINDFLQYLKSVHSVEEVTSEQTTVFLNRLILDSYNKGNRIFRLETKGYPLESLGYHIFYSYQQFNFKTLIDKALGRRALDIIVDDIGRGCGNFCKDIGFTVLGDAGGYMGRDAHRCTFKLFGKVESSDCHCNYCDFWVKDKDVYKMLKWMFKDTGIKVRRLME